MVPTTPAEQAAHARGERPGILGQSRWTDIFKPTIAAVNGVAYAGGLEWACWTDIAIADEHATFGVTCRRWNIGLADGGTQKILDGLRRFNQRDHLDRQHEKTPLTAGISRPRSTP